MVPRQSRSLPQRPLALRRQTGLFRRQLQNPQPRPRLHRHLDRGEPPALLHRAGPLAARRYSALAGEDHRERPQNRGDASAAMGEARFQGSPQSILARLQRWTDPPPAVSLLRRLRKNPRRGPRIRSRGGPIGIKTDSSPTPAAASSFGSRSPAAGAPPRPAKSPTSTACGPIPSRPPSGPHAGKTRI